MAKYNGGAKRSGGSDTHDGGRSDDDRHGQDDIFHLHTIDASVLCFIKAPDGFGDHGQHGHDGPSRHFAEPENFQRDRVGRLPSGWNDVARVDPDSPSPKPSSIVIDTRDAFGHATKALQILPALAPSQGIYRPIEPDGFYAMSVDARIDQFSDFTVEPPDCGCPPGSDVDWPLQVGFMKLGGTTGPFHLIPQVGIYVGARTGEWRLFAFTNNVAVDVSLGVPVTPGHWYGLQIELDAAAATMHGRVTDAATGDTLADVVASLGTGWDPAVDGLFDIESVYAGELSAPTTPGIATVDNIDARNPHSFPGHDDHHQQAFPGGW